MKRFRKIMHIVILVYAAYRLGNLLMINLSQPKPYSGETGFYINFEYPAPEINDVIGYDTLAFCHRCFVSREAYEENKNYRWQAFRMNMSVLICPWTTKVVCSNEELRHQYDSNYDIEAYGGYNIFTGRAEEAVIFADTPFVIISLLTPLICAVNFIVFLRNLIKRRKMTGEDK